MKLAEDLRRAVLQAAIEGNLTGGSREGWRFVRLEECASIIMGQSPKGEFINNSDGMEFHQGKIFFGDKVIQDSKLRTSTAPKIAPADSVLLSVRAPVGKVNITDREICIGRGLTAIKGYDGIPTEFIYYLLQTLEQTFIAKSTGTTFKAITSATIHNQIIPLPPLEEQRRIVSRLDVILPLIAELESAENELEALERKFPCDMREALLQAAIEGKLTGSNTDNWRWVRLGDVIIKDIGGGTPDKSIAEYWNGNIPWMSVKDFAGAKDGFIEDTIDHISEQGLEQSATNLIMPEAIIICMRMGLGKYVRLKKPTAINQDLRAIWLSDDVLADYFLYFYSTLKIEGTGTTVKGIKRNELLSYIIPLPPINEQQKIVSRLKELLPLCEAMKGE